MLTVRDVLLLTTRHLDALQLQGSSPEAQKRWAFLVTMEEIDALVNEMQTDLSLNQKLDPVMAQHIKEGRAMLHLNNIPILPELIQVPAATDS